MDGEFGVSRCKLLYIEWINEKILLYSTGNYIQDPGISNIEKEYKKACVYKYIHKTESFCYTAEIRTTLYINFTSIEKTSLKLQKLKDLCLVHTT